MRRRSLKNRLFGCAICALLSAAILLAALGAPSKARAGKDAGQTNQQQRPRKVGPTPTPSATPRTNQPPTEPSEEVGEGDVLRVETQLVSVPAFVMDRNGRPLTGLR